MADEISIEELKKLTAKHKPMADLRLERNSNYPKPIGGHLQI